MEPAHAEVVARRQNIQQALLHKEAMQAQTTRQAALIESVQLPVQQINPALPENLGKALDVRV